MLADFRVDAMVPVSDLAKAKEFYNGKLGLPVVEEMPDPVVFSAGQGTMVVCYSNADLAGKASHTLATWTVDDVTATVADLRGKGVTFEDYDMPNIKTEGGVATYGPTKAAWFKDPDGNILGLFSR